MPTVELQIGALPAHVRTARLVAAALARRLGMDSVVIDEVKLAVGEACARAVSVHRAAASSEPIVVHFRDDDDILEISVLDSGPSGAQLPSPRPARSDSGDAAEAETADLLKSAMESAEHPAEVERDIDVASLAPRLGLALISGLVDDMSVTDRPGGHSPNGSAGTVVTMRWPIVAF